LAKHAAAARAQQQRYYAGQKTPEYAVFASGKYSLIKSINLLASI
jgi:hypothetical protein